MVDDNDLEFDFNELFNPEELPIIIEALRVYAWNQIEPVCAGELTSADEPAYSDAVATEKAARELANTITKRIAR